jgi:hypothetical protein
MSVFPYQDKPGQRGQSRSDALPVQVDAAIRGETENTGKFTLAAGEQDFTLLDPRVRAGRTVLLSALDAGAAACFPYWVEYVQNQMVNIHFTSAAASTANFAYVICGKNFEDYKQGQGT